jgi:hypothetical protein
MITSLRLYSLVAGLFAFSTLVQAQQTPTDTALVWYAHDKIWVNLQELTSQPKANYQPNLHFKNSALQYNYYFSALTIDKLGYKSRFFEILPNNGLKIIDLRTDEVLTVENPDADTERYGQHFLFEAVGGVCYVKHLSGSAGYKIYKYNPLGEVLFSAQVQHTEQVKTEKLEYYRPYLQYLSHTPYELVFASYEPARSNTTVVNLTDGSIKEYPFSAQGVITRGIDVGENRIFRGFLYADVAKSNLHIILNSKAETRFELAQPFIKDCNSFEGIIIDNILVVTAHNRSKSGAHLLAVDISNGSIIWQSNIAALSDKANASGYYHKIWLSHQDNKIMVEGLETAGRYLQIYDVSSGKRLYTTRP